MRGISGEHKPTEPLRRVMLAEYIAELLIETDGCGIVAIDLEPD